MCDGKQKYEDYKVDAVVSPQSAKSPAFAYAGDFALCGARQVALPLDPARAPRPLTLASLSRKAGSKAFNSLSLKI